MDRPPVRFDVPDKIFDGTPWECTIRMPGSPWRVIVCPDHDAHNPVCLLRRLYDLLVVDVARRTGLSADALLDPSAVRAAVWAKVSRHCPDRPPVIRDWHPHDPRTVGRLEVLFHFPVIA